MDKIVSKYDQDFRSLGIEKDLENYTNADDFAKNFQRCSILSHDNVSYSSNTPSEAKEILTSISYKTNK